MYNQLPSVVLRDATSFDILVADVYTAWEQHKNNPNDPNLYSTDQLQELLNKSRGLV